VIGSASITGKYGRWHPLGFSGIESAWYVIKLLRNEVCHENPWFKCKW
jgi:hypothetical protein